MSIVPIRLPGGEWQFDETAQLGQVGGFGAVFQGAGPEGPVAVKRLHLSVDDAAHREMEINRQLMRRSLKHVVPVLDAGRDANSDRYFLVMPVCDRSLQDVINASPNGVTPSAAAQAVEAIISGLMEVSDLTHRDLKPANVLLHDGVWKIADFGIAKFVEDSTSLQTLRDVLTPNYGAPEQWRMERPTTETDVYALGCIIHALITGRPPFSGDSVSLRDHHLHAVPARLDGISDRIAGFVTQMLRKPPKARPTLARCAEVLIGTDWDGSEARAADGALARAARQVADSEARAEAEEASEQARLAERQSLINDAGRELTRIRERLYTRIKSNADSAKEIRNGVLQLGYGGIEFSPKIKALDSYEIGRGGRGPARYKGLNWDILAWSKIGVSYGGTHARSVYSWSASLIYADRRDGNGYRWYEIGFSDNPLSRSKHLHRPFALDANDEDLYAALGPAMHVVVVE